MALKLTVVARHLWQRFDRSVEQIGVSRAKWRLIAAVSHNPGSTQRTLAELLQVSEVSAGRLIDRLCADGYLERRESATDRRAHSVHLTPASQPILTRLSELAAFEEDEAFAGMDENDLEQLGRLLDVIAGNIASARGDRTRPQGQKACAESDLQDELFCAEADAASS